MLRWKLPFFKGQGYINRVIPVSGWFVLTFTCWTWWRMTRRGSRRRTAAPIEDAGGILREVSMWPLLLSGHALWCEIVQNSSCHQRDGNEAKAFIVRSFEGMETNLTSRSSHIMNTYFHIRAPPFSALCHLQFLRFVFHFSSHLFLSRRIWIHCGSQGLHSTWNIVCPRSVFGIFKAL